MKHELSKILAAAAIVTRTIGRLIYAPYITMRSISHTWDPYQIGVLWGFVYIYFLCASCVKFSFTTPPVIFLHSVRSFGYFLFTSLLLVGFFSALKWIRAKIGQGREGSKKGWVEFLHSLLMLMTYSLVPTLIWFFVALGLFILFPPPRYPTVLGNAFSIIFVGFSCTLLLWRLVLLYLTMRFAFKMNVYAIMWSMVLMGMWLLPYTILMYRLGIARIPFI